VDYNRSRATALRLIERFGNALAASFSRVAAASDFDPLTGNETIPSPVTFTASVVVPPETDRSREMGRIQGWDVQFYLPSGFEPLPGDKVTLPGRAASLTVVAPVEMVAPDGVPIYYIVRARRGQ